MARIAWVTALVAGVLSVVMSAVFSRSAATAAAAPHIAVATVFMLGLALVMVAAVGNVMLTARGRA